jgi:hypothetical protein
VFEKVALLTFKLEVALDIKPGDNRGGEWDCEKERWFRLSLDLALGFLGRGPAVIVVVMVLSGSSAPSSKSRSPIALSVLGLLPLGGKTKSDPVFRRSLLGCFLSVECGDDDMELLLDRLRGSKGEWITVSVIGANRAAGGVGGREGGAVREITGCARRSVGVVGVDLDDVGRPGPESRSFHFLNAFLSPVPEGDRPLDNGVVRGVVRTSAIVYNVDCDCKRMRVTGSHLKGRERMATGQKKKRKEGKRASS